MNRSQAMIDTLTLKLIGPSPDIANINRQIGANDTEGEMIVNNDTYCNGSYFSTIIYRLLKYIR